MSMQNVAATAPDYTAPKRNALTHIPGDEGWPIVGKTFQVLADPKGHIEANGAKYGPVYRTHVFGETNVVLLGPEANEPRDVRPAEAVFVHPWLEQGARPVVSARADAARLRRAPAASQGAVGRVQVRADEVLPGRPRPRYLGAGRAVEGKARRDAALSGDEAAHARSRGGLVPRRRHRAGGRRDQPRLRRHGRGRRRADPPSPARHADGGRRQGAQAHRRLFPRADPAAPRQSRR